MAGFYDINGKKLQATNKNKKKNTAPLAHLHTDNVYTKNTLEYDGKKFGTVTNAGLKAIENNTLDSYTPATNEEKTTIEAYRDYLRKKLGIQTSEERMSTYNYKEGVRPPFDPITDKAKEDAKKEAEEANARYELFKPNFKTTINTQFGDVEVDTTHKLSKTQVESFMQKMPKSEADKTFEKYSIDPNNFTLFDFSDWATKHNFDITYSGMTINYSPKKKGGFLGIGGKKLTTEQEEKDAKLLFALARANGNKAVVEQSKDDKLVGNVMSGAGGIAQGATFGFFDNIADTLEKSQAEKAGLPKKYQYSTSDKLNAVAQEYPVANIVGDIAGSLPLTLGVSNLVKAGTIKLFPKLANIGTKTVSGLVKGSEAGTKSTIVTNKVLSNMGKWVSKSPVAQNIVNDGITFAITSSAREAGNGGSAGEVFQAGLIGLASGGVSGGVEEKLGQIGLKILFDKKLQHKILPEIARVALANSLSGVTYNATSYVLSPQDKKPTLEDMTRDFALDLAMGAIFSAKGTIDASKSSKANIDNLYNKMESDFQTLTKMNLSKSPDVEGMKNLARDIIDYADTMQKLLKGEKVKTTIDGKSVDMVMTDYRFVGQNEYVKSMIADLDTVKGRANDFLEMNSIKGELASPKEEISAPAKANTDTIPTVENPSTLNKGKVDTTPVAQTSTEIINIPESVYVTKDSKGNKVAYGENAEILADYLDLPIRTSKENGEKSVILNDDIITDFLPFDIVETDTIQTKAVRNTKADTAPAVTTPTVSQAPTTIKSEETTPTTKGVTSAYTNNNQKIDMKYKVVSADDLIASNNIDGSINPKYPQELQPRERTRQASILQVQNIANNIVPEKLGESANVSDGSPIVSSDNVVESGNGRTMALSLMYKNNPEGAKKYIEYIKANADKFGIDANNLPKNPVLVRERLTDVDRVEFVKQANESNLSSMSATELAKSDAERLTSDILNLLVANDDGNLNTAENKAFVGRVISNVFSQNDLNSVVGANGILSANGLERIRNAMFYKAYNDVSLASKLSESLDNDIKNITNVLVNIAPKIVQIKNGIANGKLYDLDFSQDIVDGINYLQEAKRQNLKVKDFANQITMGDDVSNVVKAIAYFFEQKNRGAKQATLFFNHLCDTILEKDPNQLGFLNEDTKTPTKEEIVNEAINRYLNDEEGTGIDFSEMFVSQRSEESRQTVDERGIGNNIESVTKQRLVDSESDGTAEQHRPIEEETVVGGNSGTARQSERGTAERRTENSRNETEVGAGELSGYEEIYDPIEKAGLKFGLTEDEKYAISEYKSSGSYTLNYVLREGLNLSDEQVKLKEDFISALNKFPTYNGTVYRNIGFSEKEEFDSFISEHIGKSTVIYPAFTSASKDTNGYIIADLPYTAHYVMESMNARDVAEIGIVEEQEVLFNAGSEFEITGIEVSGNNVSIKCKEITSNENFKNELRTSDKEGRNEQKAEENVGRKTDFGSDDENSGKMGDVRGRSNQSNEAYGGTTEHNGDEVNGNVLENSGELRKEAGDELYAKREPHNELGEVSDNAENNTPKLTDKCELHSTKHTSTGDGLWVVTLKDKLSAEDYKKLNAKVKSVGGYYSRFAKTPDGKAIPGFVFKTEPTANELNVFNYFFAGTEAQNVSESENARITKNMSDSERYEILKDKIISDIPSVDNLPQNVIESIKNDEKIGNISSWEDINKYFGSKKRTLIQKIASEFGVFKDYNNSDINIEFTFSKNDYRESYGKQKHNFESFAKMFSAFDKVVENAIGIEVHNRNDEGYKPDVTLKNSYVLISAFSDGDLIYPVKLEVKEFSDKKNSLYVAISLEAIKKTEVSKQGTTENGVAQNSRSVDISIQDIFKNVNISDIDFLKYIPNQFLTDEQIEAKNKALEEEKEKYSHKKTETPTQNAQNTPKSSENASGEQKPVEAENVATGQNISYTEAKGTANTTVNSEGTKQIADFVASKLAKGKSFTSMELLKVSTVAFGGTMANNAFAVKDAYDAMELGVNKYILSMKDVSAEKMFELLELLPTQTKRTEEMVKFQQFSTPPSIAYLANYVANVNAKDTMLEPSAGIGGIAVFAKRDGATVYVNELDNRRLEVLKNMPFDRFFNENAEQLDNILGGEIEPTVIVMNPPFSSSSERNMHNTKIGAKHIEQALKILSPNGRLVAIVGRGMEDGAPAFRDWWKGIKSEYNVRANIRIDGKNYSKYGTNFDIQMLVIDKNGATTHTEIGSVDTLQELQERLEGIRNERPTLDYKGIEQKPSKSTRTETSSKRKATDVGIEPVSGTGSIADTGKSTDTPRPSRKSNAEVLQTVDADNRGLDNQTPETANVVDDEQQLHGRGERGGHTELRDSGRVDVSDSGQHSEQSTVDRSDGNVRTRQNDVGVQRPKRTELTDSIFEQYQTQPLKFKNTKAHPGKVSESAAMSAITPPAVTYKPHISQDIVENGVVSDVQLEAISYAGQSHSQVLANGTTRGFFLGDGTGIGKGRTIAGIILDNYNQGRKKAVWVTENSSLMLDAKRDLTALFGNSDLLMQFEGGKKADKIYSQDEAILAVSYSTLSRGYDKKDSNYAKIVDWLGKDFDGVIVFDEAHNMANATGKKGKRGGSQPSQTGLAGIALQEALPKAKVVYSSATGATEVENLRYAERLGLWGEGTAFTNGDDFVGKIKAGGIASMELIARDMKAMGVYLSRNISYDDVQYDKITHELTAQQVKIYDELARSWQVVLQNINKALEATNQDKDGHARGRALGAFWSSQQRFFNQILTSMQVPSVISDIEKQLADGKSCVIQLVSTNESAQNREMERIKSEDLDLDDFDLTPKQMLMSMIENSFPVQQFEEYRDDNGNIKSKPVVDSMGNPVINREAVRQREELLDKLGSIKVPSSPIDMIINHFGTDLVAEKTGRSRRVIQKDGKTIEENIASKKDADVDAFQNGDKRIMIFSKAGGTGKSYHADKSAKNQQQRVHYLLEAGWQADKAVQGFGRSHRSNQVSAPIFKLVTTNLKGQMRFISTIAKRLDQLGAMTKGQRQAGGQGMFSASDNLENTLASDVLAVFYKDLLANRVDGISNGLAIIERLGLKDKILDEYNSIRVTAEELRDVSKFLNRILSLESSEQNTVFDGYAQRLQEATEKAKADGTLDKGLENYKADKITLNEVKDIREDSRSGAKTKYYNLTAEHKIKPVKFENIQTESKSFVGFYRNKNTGVVRAVMRTSSVTDQYGNVSDNYKLIGQIKNEYIPQYRLYGNWVEVTADEAKTAWDEELTKLPEYRKENLHLMSGVVLPVWDKLPTENVRIYRVLTSDGEMLIGRVVSEDMIDETLRRLGSSRTREKIATKDLIEGIKNGDTVYLDNEWKIVQSRVSGENRIELAGVTYEHADLVKKKGVFTERIQYFTRYFIPTDTNTEKIIDDILEISPVFRVENKKYSTESEDFTSGREGNLLPNGSSEWSYSTSARKQVKGVDGRTRRYKEGRTASYERRKYCQTLKASGNTKEEIVYGHKCEVIPAEHYTAEMTNIADSNKRDGIDETIFITGKAVIPFTSDSKGVSKTARGVFIKINGKKIAIVQYDNEFYTPEQINDHEKIHDKYHTSLVQKAKNVIMNSLSVADKRQVFEKLSRDYNGIVEGNEEAIEEEFVANVLSEMDYEFGGAFSDIRKAYWKGDADAIDNFKVSEYTESIDAGGIIDNIGLGNDTDLISSNQLYISAEEYAVISKAIMAKNAGLSDNELKPFDFVYSANNFYTYKNHSLGNFTIIKKVDIVKNKELIREIIGEIKNGTNRGTESFNSRVERIRSGKRSDSGYNGSIERTDTHRSDDRLPFGTQRSDTVRHPLGDGVYHSGNYVKYSADSAESDIEELTPERKKAILEQFDENRVGFDKPSQKQLWGERAKWVANNISRVFPNIPERGEKGTYFAEFRKNMIQWTKLPQTASFMSQDKLNQMTRGLTPAEYKTFSELVYFLDLQEEAQIQKERGYTEILLPNEITPTEVNAIVKVLNEEATENVKKALDKRQDIWNALKTQYIELNRQIGFDTDGKFKRKNYYHHQVIEYMNKGGKGIGHNEIGIKAGRGWLKERQGSTKAINTDFLAVENQALLQMQYDVYIAETLGKIKEQYDIKPQLEVEARNHNKQALNDIIRKEATDENGNILLDIKGKPDSETYRQQMWYNTRIMMAFDGLFDLAERGELPTYDGEYAGVVEALKRGNLNANGLYKYVGILANTSLPDNATDAQEQAVIKARTVLKYTSQKREWIKSVLADDYQTWETIARSMSDTHSIHQPRRGNYFYTKTIVDEDAFDKAYQEMVLSLASGDVDFGNEDINKLFSQYADTVRLMGVAYEQWVLPKEIVTTMGEIANPKQAGEIAKLARSIITAWKGWSTGLNPTRTVKYGVRNMLGDLDAVIAGKPQVVKYSVRAIQDIWQAMKNENYSPEFMEWVERGGYTAMQYVNEMDTEMQDKLFSHLKEKSGINVFKIPLDLLKGYANGVEAIHNFREAILRYSAYLYFKEEINRNNGNVKDNVASNRYIVRGLNTIEDKAYQLSKDLLGAYDEIGKMGQTLRRYWVPFYSFTETNLKRYYRMFENVIMSDDKVPKKAGKLLHKMLMVNMLTLLITAWNKLFMEEEDEKLPPSSRNIPHITLGQYGDNVIAFTKPSSFSDILEWVGLEDYKWTKEDITAPVDKAWGMITPFVKLPVELASGLNFYPSLTQPRAIRDKWQHFFNSWGVANIYNEFAGKPTRGWGEIVKGAFVYSYDYKESAYYEILDIKRKYQGDTDNTIYGADDKSNALYYMKQAIRYKDEKAALKYLDEYFENGGTAKGIRQSIKMLHPLYGYTSKDTYEKGVEFIASLTDEEKEKLRIAQDYYEENLELPEIVYTYLGQKSTTVESAKKVLTTYIKSQCK